MLKRSNRDTIFLKIILIGFSILMIGSRNSQAEMKFTLDQAMEYAMKNSSDIINTELDLEQSEAQIRAQEAALKSRFSLSLNPFSFSRDEEFDSRFSDWSTRKSKRSSSTFTISQPITKTDGTLSLRNGFYWQDSSSDAGQGFKNISYYNGLNLSFTQPIFTYNRTKLQIRQLELSNEQTYMSYALQKLNLERQVTQSFYSVYQRKTSLDISTEELKNQEASFQIIKDKVDAGLNALEELYQAELNLANSKLSHKNIIVSLENALDSFKEQLGLPLSEEVTIEVDIPDKPVEISLEKALETGLKNRTELRQREIGMENALYSLMQTEAQNEFRGNITLSYGITGTDEKLANLFDAPTKTQTIGFSLDIPLWDWGEKKSRIKSSKINIERQKLSYDDQIRAITLSIKQSHRNLANLVEQIFISRQSVRNAELTYEINLERYKNGDLTSMDLNLYQTQLTQIKIGLVNSIISYRLALLDMKIQSLWDFELNEPVFPDKLFDSFSEE